MKREVTNFTGFDDKGFSPTEVGNDIVSIFYTPESWDEDNDGEKPVGTPVQVDFSADFTLKVCPDGEVPDGFLNTFVGDPYPGRDDFYIQNRDRDFVEPGKPADFVRNRQWGVLDTTLLADSYTSPDKEDDIYVENGKFTDTDPLAGSGVSIGTVYDTKTIDGETYVIIVLNEETR